MAKILSRIGRCLLDDCLRILHRPCNASDTTCRLDCIHPGFLLRSYPAGRSLDLNGQKDRYMLANHIWRNGDLLPTDQVGAALAKTKLDRASVGILQRPGVIAE